MPNQSPLNQKTDREADGSSENIHAFLTVCSNRVENNIRSILNKFCSDSSNDTLLESIQYSIFNGGKRIRPGLVYATAQLIGLKYKIVEPIASAVELIHCYSLIHDDLPAMDDDNMRRGKPSCHSVFGEAIAILAGDAMQALAFECLNEAPLIDAKCKTEVCRTLAHSVGISGMASGQAMDILMDNNALENNQIKEIHRLKTGALMETCITMVLCCAPNTPRETVKNLKDYAANIGLCFQIRDDILDAKQHAMQSKIEKPSYVTIYGAEASKKALAKIKLQCLNSLRPLGTDAQPLRDITHHITSRES